MKRRLASVVWVWSFAVVAQAECIQGKDGTIYSCGGSPRWNFETGTWNCTNSANGQTVSGERTDCSPRGRDGGVDAGNDDLLEPLVDERGKRRVIPPGDPRRKHEQPR